MKERLLRAAPDDSEDSGMRGRRAGLPAAKAWTGPASPAADCQAACVGVRWLGKAKRFS
jgi:hypothetical protein